MVDEMKNIGEFKKACEAFYVRFRDTDDRQVKDMIVNYYIDGKRKFIRNIDVTFIHSTNVCKVDIGSFEDEKIHCEVSTKWQCFNFENPEEKLTVTGISSKHGHRYKIEVLASNNT